MNRRKNGQVAQPGIAQPPEGNGWPVPLTDDSNPLKFPTTDGKSGKVESRRVEDCKTGAYSNE